MALSDGMLLTFAGEYAGDFIQLGVATLGMSNVECENAADKQYDTQTNQETNTRAKRVYKVLMLWKGKKGNQTTEAVKAKDLYDLLILANDHNISNEALNRILLSEGQELKDGMLLKLGNEYAGDYIQLGVATLGMPNVECENAVESRKMRVKRVYEVLKLWKGKMGNQKTEAVQATDLCRVLVNSEDHNISNEALMRILKCDCN